MKRLILVLAIMFIVTGLAYAEDLKISNVIEKMPPLKQGIAYSMSDNDLCYLSTIEILNWKGIALEGGYSSKDKIVAVISYELLKLKDLGVTIPLLDLITARVGIYGGYGNINLTESISDSGGNKGDWGLSLTLLDIKF